MNLPHSVLMKQNKKLSYFSLQSTTSKFIRLILCHHFWCFCFVIYSIIILQDDNLRLEGNNRHLWVLFDILHHLLLTLLSNVWWCDFEYLGGHYRPLRNHNIISNFLPTTIMLWANMRFALWSLRGDIRQEKMNIRTQLYPIRCTT